MSTSYRMAAPTMSYATSIDGQDFAKHHRLSGVSIVGLVIIGVLFAAFLYFYISPLFQTPAGPIAQNSTSPTTPGGGTEAGFAMDQAEKNSLMAWIRRRSRGRFADTAGNYCGTSPQSDRSASLSPTPRNVTGEKPPRGDSFFSRISIVPHLTLPTKLPPAYSSRPLTPTSASLNLSRRQRSNLAASHQLTAPPAVSSPLAQKPLRVTHNRFTDPPHRIFFRSNSAPAESETSVPESPGNESKSIFPDNTSTKARFRLNDASRSLSDCTLHPAWMARPLTSPSKAVVVLNQRPPKHTPRVAPPRGDLEKSSRSRMLSPPF